MARKIRDITVKTGEYQDRNTGETKGRWQNVGSLMQNDEDQSYFIVLDRTFNPAGVPNPENRSSVILSCFVPRDQRQSQNGSGNQRSNRYGYDQSPQGHQGNGGYGAGGRPGGDLEDEIPFAMEWRA